MNIYEVHGITANLASVGSTCNYMRAALIFTKDSVYLAPEEILIPGQVKVGSYNVAKGLYEVDGNFLEQLGYSSNKKSQSNNIFSDYSLLTSYTPSNPALLFHWRFGCLNVEYMKKAKIKNSIEGLENISMENIEALRECPCIGCIASQRAKFARERGRGRANLKSNYRNSAKNNYRRHEIAIDFGGPIPLPEDQLRFQNKSMICYFLHLQSRRGWTYATTSISKFPQILRQFMRDYNQDNFGYEPEFYSSYDNKHWVYDGHAEKDTIKMVRMDNAPSFTTPEMMNVYEKYKIKPVKTAPNVHYMNPCERFIQTVNRITCSQLANAKLTDKEFQLCYISALKDATDVYNYRPHSGIDYMTPYEAFHGVKPHMNWRRCWGATMFEALDSQRRPNGKFSRRFAVGVLTGMRPVAVNAKHPIMDMYRPDKHKHFNVSNASLDETFSHSQKRLETLRSGEFYIDLTENKHRQVLMPTSLPKFDGVVDWKYSNFNGDMQYEYTPNENEAVKAVGEIIDNKKLLKKKLMQLKSKLNVLNSKRKSGRKTKTPKRYGWIMGKDRYVWKRIDKAKEYALHAKRFLERRKKTKKLKLLKANKNEIEVEIGNHIFYVLLMRRKKNKRRKKNDFRDKPRTFSDNVKITDWDNPDLAWAKLRDDWPMWQDAIQKEVDQLEHRGTWREAKQDENPKRLLDTKLVLKIKRKEDLSIIKYKARLTARGFLQRYNLDYKDTHSPVTENTTFKLLLANSKRRNRRRMLIDFAGAFLYPLLKEEIYIKAPELYRGTGKVLKLLKTLYGLKQASHEWNKLLTQVLKEMGFQQQADDIDQCLFIHKEWDINMCVHVDDCLLDFSNIKNVEKMLKILKERKFDYTESEKFTKALGIRVEENENSITLSQPNYVKIMLKDFELENCIEFDAPPTQWESERSEDEESFDEGTYRSIIGCLAYLARMTRPDIEMYVFHLATFVANPGVKHWNAVVKLMGYLKKFPNYGISFKNLEEGNLWEFYVDADWAGCPSTRKSTTGYIIRFMGGPLITVSRRQKNVTLSSCESEYCAFTDIVKDIKWVKKLASVLEIPFPTPAEIFNDNQTAQNLASGVAKLNRTKHIDARYHFIKECTKLGIVELIHIPRNDNLADLFTHPVARAIHKQMRCDVLNLGKKVIQESTNQYVDMAIMSSITV